MTGSNSNITNKIWKILKTIFWLFRVFVLFLFFLFVCCFVYLEYVGTPKSVKDYITKQLQSDNLKLSFSDIRIDWLKGIVVDDIKIEPAKPQNVIPIIYADSVEIMPSFGDLLKNSVRVKKIIIKDGTITLTTKTNGDNQIINNIYLTIRLNNNSVSVNGLTAKYKNIKLRGNWIIDNTGKNIASDSNTNQSQNLLSKTFETVHNYLYKLNDWRFSTNTEIAVNIYEDAGSNIYSITPSLRAEYIANKEFTIHNIDTYDTQINITNNVIIVQGRIQAEEIDLKTNKINKIDCNYDIALLNSLIKKLNLKKFSAGSGTGEFGTFEHFTGSIYYDGEPIESFKNSTNRFEFKARANRYENHGYTIKDAAIEGNLPLSAIFNNDNIVELKIDCNSIKHNVAIINGLKGKYQGRVKLSNTAFLDGQLNVNINSYVKDKLIIKYFNINGNLKYNGKDLPDLYNTKIKAENVDIGKIRFKNIEIDTYDRIKQKSDVVNSNNIIDWIVNYNADYKTDFEGSELLKIKSGHINASITNHNIHISNINIVTEKSSASGKISYNLDTEELESSIDARVSIEDLTSYIGQKYSNIVSEIKLKEPITIKLNARNRANIINNIKENRWGDFTRSLNINAVLNGKNIKIKEIEINETDIKCRITPNIIKVEEIKIVSGENRINGSIVIDEKNQRYDSRIAGITKPELLINIYNEKKELINKIIKIEQPVEFDAEISGSITNNEDIKINAAIAATNIIFRGKSIKEFRSKVEWLDRVLTFSKFELIRTNEQATGDYIIADFNKERVYLKNVWGNITPSDLTEAISEEVNNALKPVIFKAPPNVLANGSVPMHGANGDIRFDIYAPEFKWWKINPKSASCSVFWKGETMLITNFNSDFYGGSLKTTLYVDFNNQNKSNLFFDVKLDSVSARSMLKDILDKPKNVEGRLSGNLTIKSAVIDDYQNWSGGGNVVLEDGLIWDIKVFGVFSSILNMISPGLGNSRAKYASASFIVTNGVVYSDNLEIRGTALKMQYKGSVDFNKKVDARVEAEVLSEVWLFGTAIKFLLKPLTKLFIYKVTGTIDEPALEPVYIPKILLAPFQPFKTIKSFIFPKPSDGEESNKSSGRESSHNRVTPLPDEEKASK